MLYIPTEERQEKEQLLESLATQEIGFELLSRQDLIKVVERLSESPQLTTIGRQFYENIVDTLIFADPQETHLARSVDDARGLIRHRLDTTHGYAAYITGGLEAGMHHKILVEAMEFEGMSTVILGVEPAEYIETHKERQPLLTTQEKLSLWKELAPKGAIIFLIPERPDDISAAEYYDWLAQRLDVYNNDKVIFVGSRDDKAEIIEARRARAIDDKHTLNITVGNPPIHTSDLLK